MTTDLRERLQATLGATYEIERELGGGGMSRVFAAEETSLGRRVVVKVLPPELAAEVSLERFRREIRLVARLQHPHIVPLLSAGEVGELLYYTMPHVEGETLRSLLMAHGELAVADAVRLLRDVADALGYAHRHGVVHRDLKPENILLDESHALVADFGVAKALSASSDTATLTSLGVALGTPAYMAPEQALADPHVDHRADVYAFGVVAYEMLTGQAPFALRPPQAQLAAHATEAPESITARRPGIPTELAALVMRCLEKRPADRPQSAEELVAGLEAVRTPSSGGMRTVQSTSDSQADGRTEGAPAARAGPGIRRQAVIIVGGALVLAALGGAAVLISARAGTGVGTLDPKRVAVAVFENQTGDPALEPLGRMAADWLAQGLAQTQIVDVVPSSSVVYAMDSRRQRPGAGAQPAVDPVGALAEATGAGLVVSGAYYRQADSVRFQAQVTDATRGKLLRALEPVTGPLDHPTQAIEGLRQRVTAGLAAHIDTRLAALAWSTIEPPSYEAYREYTMGLERFYRLEYPAAIVHFARAAALDSSSNQSTSNQSLIWATMGYVNMDRYAEADSIARGLVARRERLSALERHTLDWAVASIHGDRAGFLDAARRVHQLTPGSDLSEFMHGISAERINRPGEAVAALVQVDERGPMGEWESYWNRLTGSYHMLGDHRRELEAARRGRARFPTLRTLLYEVRALAALGKVDEISARLEESLTLPPHRILKAADVMERVSVELRAHGHTEAARAAADRAVVWYRARPAVEQTTGAWRHGLARSLLLTSRLEEARALAEQLVVSKPDNWDYLGLAGVLAATRADRRGAERMSAELDSLRQPYLLGRHTFWRARIAAALGDRERAIALLRQAFQEGEFYREDLHAIVEFESLRNDRSFQELLRPKG